MDIEKRNNLPNSLEEHWMPFTSNKDYKNSPRLMVKAEGVYYTDHHGNKLIDASSGLFCSPAGHSRPEIREAVSKQLKELENKNLIAFKYCDKNGKVENNSNPNGYILIA